MKLNKVECSSCGAQLDYQEGVSSVTCSSCGSVFQVEKSLEELIVSSLTRANQTKSNSPEKKVSFKFIRSVEQVKQDWLNLLLKDENAPIDVAYKANITEIKKEYYPFAIYDVTCEGDWQATSIWEHQESYQVARDVTVYIDRSGNEHRGPGTDTIVKNGNVYHPQWRPMNKTVYDTKYRTVTDNIERTSGYTGSVTFSKRVWLGNDENRTRFFDWTANLSTDSYENFDPENSGETELMEEFVARDDAENIAIEAAKDDLADYASNQIPGNRFEDFSMSGRLLDITRTTCYMGIYHIFYEYNGTPFECWISGGQVADNDFSNHPIDASLKERTDKFDKEIKNSSFASRKTLFLLGFPLLFIIALFLGTFAIAAKSGIISVIFSVLIALGGAYCLARFIMMQVKHTKLGNLKRVYTTNNTNLKAEISKIVQDDSHTAEEKHNIIEKLVVDHSSDLESSESKINKAKKASTIMGILISAGVTIALTLCIVVPFILPSIQESIEKNKPAVVFKDDEIDVGDEIEFGSYKSEPIEWIVLDKTDGRMLVICNDALFDYDDRVQYDDWPRDVTWASCNLRKHLNSDEFLDSIFTESEQKTIIETELSTADNPYYGTSGGKDTDDKLFLPSAYDVVKYFKTTKDARCNWITEGGKCAYWLRTPGKTASQVAYVAADGSIDFEGDSSTTYTVFSHLDDASFNDMYVIVSARPMMWLKLDTYDEDDDCEYGDSDLINEISGETTSATTNRTTGSTTDSSSGANNDSTRYKKQAFAGLTYEIPSDSTIETGNDGQMIIGFPSECCGVIIYAIDLDDNQVNAGNEASYNSAMLQSFIDENSGTNVQYFDTNVNGKNAPSALCNLYYNGSSLATELVVFCNNDYSKMYVIVFSIFNPSAFSDTDEAIFNHFIDSIVF